jgi:hypothetical protein
MASEVEPTLRFDDTRYVALRFSNAGEALAEEVMSWPYEEWVIHRLVSRYRSAWGLSALIAAVIALGSLSIAAWLSR